MEITTIQLEKKTRNKLMKLKKKYKLSSCEAVITYLIQYELKINRMIKKSENKHA